MKISKKNLVILCVLGAIVVSTAVAAPLIISSIKKIQISCIGDSITYGQGVKETRDKDSYPAYLQQQLGNKYSVSNFGKNGATALKNGNIPYVKSNEYKVSLQQKADYFIFMLGTNDSKAINWSKSNDGKKYNEDYKSLINTYLNKYKKAKVIMLLPPRSHNSMDRTSIDDNLIKTTIADCVKAIAKDLKASVVNLYNLTKDHPEWYKEGLHPNKIGNKKIAEYIYSVVKKQTNYW